MVHLKAVANSAGVVHAVVQAVTWQGDQELHGMLTLVPFCSNCSARETGVML